MSKRSTPNCAGCKEAGADGSGAGEIACDCGCNRHLCDGCYQEHTNDWAPDPDGDALWAAIDYEEATS